jgi:hypothetical protein
MGMVLLLFVVVIAEHRMVAPPWLSHHGSRAMRLFHQNDNDNKNGNTLVHFLEVTRQESCPGSNLKTYRSVEKGLTDSDHPLPMDCFGNVSFLVANI